MNPTESTTMSPQTIRVSYVPYSDMVVARVQHPKTPQLVRLTEQVVIYVNHDDPAHLVGFDIDSFTSDFDDSDQAALAQTVGSSFIDELRNWLDNSVRPLLRQLPLLNGLTEDEVLDAFTMEPQPLEADLPELTPELERARLEQVRAYLEKVLADTPGLLRIPTPLEGLKERARAALESAKGGVWSFQRQQLAVAGARLDEPEPGEVPDAFRAQDIDASMTISVEGSLLHAEGWLPVDSEVVLTLDVILTERGHTLVEEPLCEYDPHTRTLAASGVTKPTGRFRIQLGRVGQAPSNREPLVESFELTLAPRAQGRP